MVLSVVRSLANKLMGRRAREALFHTRAARSYAADYLEAKGWIRSMACKEAIGVGGPIPWITYPALMMLERVVTPEHKVFEYGCGNSSLWWSKRVAEVVSVEHNEAWANKVASEAPPNLRVQLAPMGMAADAEVRGTADGFFELHSDDLPTSGKVEHDIQHGLACKEFTAYATELAKYGKGHFDIVVVDGMARSLTAWIAANHVKEDGFIVFDNSDRWQYNVAFDILSEHGFGRIDFYGTGPLNTYEWCTSIFCKDLAWTSRNVRVSKTQGSDLGW